MISAPSTTSWRECLPAGEKFIDNGKAHFAGRADVDERVEDTFRRKLFHPACAPTARDWKRHMAAGDRRNFDSESGPGGRLNGAAGLGGLSTYPGPRSVAASFSTRATDASDGVQSGPRLASGERCPSWTLGLSNQARMPMALYPPARLDVTQRTHSRRRTISCGTGRRPWAYERTEFTDRRNNLASSASPRSHRSSLNTSWSMPESYGVPT
jgi:hypothetical protein